MTHNSFPQETTPLPSEQPSVYFSGGYGYGKQRNSAVLDHIAGLGYDIVPPLPNPDLRNADTGFRVVEGGDTRAISRREAFRLVATPAIEQSTANFQEARADEVISEFENHGRKINAIFQSADALNGLIAVHRRPDLVENVVLAYPAGVIKQPHPFRAVRGVLKSVSVGRRPTYRVVNNFERPGGIRPSKTAGGFVTAASVALSYQGPLLSEVRKQDDAPGVSLVLGTGDWMMRPERVLETLKPDDVDYVLVTNTPHGVNGRPEVMDKVLGLFPMMERAKQERKAGESLKPLVNRLIFTDSVPAAEQRKLINLAREADWRAKESH